jgi:molecular chaperone DnaJ
MPGPPGSEPGDLYVDIEVAEDPHFERQGYDLIAKRVVSFPEAALGTEVTVDLPDGTNLTAKVPSGTQPHTVITISGKGLPHLDRRSRGALHVIVEVSVPKRLSKHAKKLLEELAGELDGKETRAEAR